MQEHVLNSGPAEKCSHTYKKSSFNSNYNYYIVLHDICEYQLPLIPSPPQHQIYFYSTVHCLYFASVTENFSFIRLDQRLHELKDELYTLMDSNPYSEELESVSI